MYVCVYLSLCLYPNLYPNLITEKQNIHDFLTEGEPNNTTNPPIGGNAIKWVKISDNPTLSENEPQVLYLSLSHAREAISLTQNIYYMWYLLENYSTSEEVKNILDNTELYFIPVVNPDGLLYNEISDGTWRKNRKNNGDGTFGVDLNRNFDYYINGDPNNNVWGGEGASHNSEDSNYCGTAPFSEIESQAIKWFVENHQFNIALNFHASGGDLLYPFNYMDNAPSPEDEFFQSMGYFFTRENKYNVNQGFVNLYPASGNTTDFLYGTTGSHAKIYAYTPEHAYGSYTSDIENACKNSMHLNLGIAKVANDFAFIEEFSNRYTGTDLNQEVNFTITRLGLNGPGNFQISLNPISANMTVTSPTISVNDLAPFTNFSDLISYQLEPSIQPGDSIVFELIVESGVHSEKITVEKRYGNLESFFVESGDTFQDTFLPSDWGTSSTIFNTAPFSMTDSPTGNYENLEETFLEFKPSIDLSQAIQANITFQAQWELEKYLDFVQLQVSIDNGQTWEGLCGNYTLNTEISHFLIPGEPYYSGLQENWILEEVDLNNYLGESIRLRFRLYSNVITNLDGFYFDDFKINKIGTVTLNNEQESNLKELFRTYPNPAKNILNIQTKENNYSIKIYTIDGKQLLYQSNLSFNQTIDISDYSTGAYFLKVITVNGRETMKIIKE